MDKMVGIFRDTLRGLRNDVAKFVDHISMKARKMLVLTVAFLLLGLLFASAFMKFFAGLLILGLTGLLMWYWAEIIVDYFFGDKKK